MLLKENLLISYPSISFHAVTEYNRDLAVKQTVSQGKTETQHYFKIKKTEKLDSTVDLWTIMVV